MNIQDYQITNSYPQIGLNHSVDSLVNRQRLLEQQYLNSAHPEYRYGVENFSKYLNKYQNDNSQQPDYHSSFTYASKNILNSIPFNGSTSYKDHYQQHPIAARVLNPELYRLPYEISISPRAPIRFQGESSYKADYKNSDIMDKMRMLNSEKINRKAHWSESKTPFYGNSSYKSQFQPFRVQLRKRQNESVQPMKSVPFAGTSTYTKDFQDFKIQLPRKAKCDVQYLPVPFKTPSNKQGSHIYYDWIENKFV